ncbi:LacI family transcriptional regulator [Rhodococcus sp. AD45-ID]|uniref:LacI family DNA-binding transcriptional regulator n=1 Tax=unclassified Rhodococcus (in: high G+C Gram-positive bacteria) TaxID=192944 RepID=UPI0005D42F72|nr:MULTISPECIES: LacI family DNA-binding transcriptional regulator [unclassified Rhodococcus (in: high G+C Gram-positive bacteria)]KJF24513.1 Raffinose operon repressor [Rhodococcus sp. AD45]PSR42797.1 LacI family transcriptional regulator [Rhodococcus sp. AD45-ID]
MITPNVPTLRDVAAAAGVAVSTVSYALNGKGRVDGTTRARVQEVADRLGYRANRSAQNLRTGRTATLGLMLPTRDELSSSEYLNFDWYGRVATAATQAAFHADHSLLLLPSMKDPNGLRRIEMDGALVVDPMTHDPRVDILNKLGIPTVAVGPGSREQFGWTISPNLFATTETLLDHLTEKGATDILVLNPGMDSAWNRATTTAYREWCRTHSVTPRATDELATFEGVDTVEKLVAAAYSTTHEALTSENPPDAILSFILGCAPAAARAALDLGLSIPGSILIAQNSDEPALLISDPPITAVDFFPEEQAAFAVDALLALINGDEPRNQGHTRGELRVRVSTDRTVGT